MIHSIKNRSIAKTASKPRKLRTMPNYGSYGMKDPTKVVKKANPHLDNTDKRSKK
jgi:hypothetical protein